MIQVPSLNTSGILLYLVRRRRHRGTTSIDNKMSRKVKPPKSLSPLQAARRYELLGMALVARQQTRSSHYTHDYMFFSTPINDSIAVISRIVPLAIDIESSTKPEYNYTCPTCSKLFNSSQKTKDSVLWNSCRSWTHSSAQRLLRKKD